MSSFLQLSATGLRWGLVALLCLVAGLTHAQHDVILRIDGEELPAKVLIIGPDSVSYTRPAAPTDTVAIATAQVFMIRYANGTREVLAQLPQAPLASTEMPQEEAIRRGAADARQYYKGQAAFWGTYGATVAYPVLGLITGVAVAAGRPSVSNLKVPDATLLQNPHYVMSYQKQAQHKKMGKAAAGFGAGMGTLVVIIVALVSSVY